MMQNLKIQYPGRARIRVRFRVANREEAMNAVYQIGAVELRGFYLRWATFEKHQRSNTHHVAFQWEPISEGNVRVPPESEIEDWLKTKLAA